MTSSFGDQKSPMMTSANNVGEGWHQLLHDLEDELNALDPEFEIHQVKEKFGGLRYYAGLSAGKGEEASAAFHNAINQAEAKSFHICEECGKPGELNSDFGWLKTLCEVHAQERRDKRQKQFRM